MRRRNPALLLLVSLAPAFLGCSTSEPIKAAAEKVTHEGPKPIVEVAFTHITEDPLARFAVAVTNPADKARTGIKLTWKALDDDGVIVGTYDHDLAPVGPGETTYYVGGAGAAHLSGIPARIEVEVTEDGEIVTNPAPSGVRVEKAEFERSAFDLEGGRTYEASAVLEALDVLNPQDVNANIILLDKKGRVVGADFGDASTAPQQVAEGERFKITSLVTVPKGRPASVEVYAWE